MANKRAKAGTSKAAAEHRRARFVEAYIRLDGNGTKAAIAAGWPARSAHVAASRLLKDAKVFHAIVERKAQVLAQLRRDTLISQEEVLQDLSEAMRFNPKLLYRSDGSLIPMHELPDELARQLEGTEYEEIYSQGAPIGRVAKVKYPKKVANREQAMKFFGLFKKHQEQAGRAAGVAAGEAAGRAVAEALDFDAIEARIKAKLQARRRGR